MTKKEVMLKAIEGRITWIQAADILGITARHMHRIKTRYEEFGFDALRDHRAGQPRRRRIPLATVEKLLALRRTGYADFSVRHFWEHATERHGLELSYTWTLLTLQAAGLAEKAPARGKYRRRRERRPLRGMLLHLDASTHAWLGEDRPMADLNVMLDDADGRILFARFFDQEGTASTFAALEHVLGRHGRFSELYTDRGSHFCRTSRAGQGPDEAQEGQVTRALRTLGIRQILARSPEARGRSERCFGTVQGRLPQELKLADITDYEQANRYVDATFVADFNRRFTVKPTQPESAFVPLAGIDLRLLLSSQHERVVGNDNTVSFNRLVLQLPTSKHRLHHVRCPVLVHEFPNLTLGVSYQGRLLAAYSQQGDILTQSKTKKRKAA
ncbi:MAG: ISNCY family transposase [Dehalococcoidia bacterium]|nr:ISNCY family transposase [Dehalococcoidia bacterium]